MNFFVLPPGAPAAVDLPTPPSVPLAALPALTQIKVDLPRLELATDSGAAAALARVAGGGGAAGPGASPGRGAGYAEGPGTGGEGDYIDSADMASPRTIILPPKAPGSVAGHTYRVKFWVGADGRVTRVEVEPPISDAAYRREFLARMQAYWFTPAHTRDGQSVASVVTVKLTIGN